MIKVVNHEKKPHKNHSEGQPRGLAVKCMRSAASSLGSDPGCASRHHSSSHAEATSHIQQLEGCAAKTDNYVLGLWREKNGGGLAIDVSSEQVFLSKKRRISTDVSSGLLSLTKKNK